MDLFGSNPTHMDFFGLDATIASTITLVLKKIIIHTIFNPHTYGTVGLSPTMPLSLQLSKPHR